MDRWDLILMAMAAYVAVVVLIRLMARRRNAIMGQLRQQMETEKSRPKGRRRKARDDDQRQDDAA